MLSEDRACILRCNQISSKMTDESITLNILLYGSITAFVFHHGIIILPKTNFLDVLNAFQFH